MDVLKGRQFATTFALDPRKFAWLLGAGASAAAGIPTGYQMILDFKAKLFCQFTRTPAREFDPSERIWRERIDLHLAKHAKLPLPGDPSEYAAAFEAIYPSEVERRQYIDNQVRNGKPTIGHRAIGSLLAGKLAHCVFTTNFDQLIENSATLADNLLPAKDQARPTVAAIDNAARAKRCVRESDWPLIAKLHGDYQSCALKNTSAELDTQDVEMREVLQEVCRRFGLIVVGYSGRDKSVMDALYGLLGEQDPFPAGVVWVCSEQERLIPEVQAFLTHAHQAGVDVSIVESSTFDELLTDLVDASSIPAPLKDHVFSGRVAPLLAEVEPPNRPARKHPVLRLSALPITQMPTLARRITLMTGSTSPAIRAMLKEANVRATVACTGNTVAAFGSDQELLRALDPLGPSLNGEIELRPSDDSWALGLLYDALVRAVCREQPLHPRLSGRGHTISVSHPPRNAGEDVLAERRKALASLTSAYGGPLTGPIQKHAASFSEGLQIRMDEAAGNWWCVFEPATFVDFNAGTASHQEGADTRRIDPTVDWRRERWAGRYNQFWSNAIGAWASMLAGREQLSVWGGPASEGVDATFVLGDKTAWSRPAHEHHHYMRRTK